METIPTQIIYTISRNWFQYFASFRFQTNEYFVRAVHIVESIFKLITHRAFGNWSPRLTKRLEVTTSSGDCQFQQQKKKMITLAVKQSTH